jgi:hypothetical protein
LNPLSVALAALSGGSILLAGQMLVWFGAQDSLLSVAWTSVGEFFLLEAAWIGVVGLGMALLLRHLAAGVEGDYTSVRKIVSDALASREDRRAGVAIGLAYAAFYAVVSSFVVYQPTVDFARVYGATGPGFAFAGCCGAAGAVPSLVVYLAPALHLGMQLVPVDLVFLAVIPVLVGVNVTVASFALRNRPRSKRRGWLGGVGAVVALFTACPTCAGYFLASGLGGLGAATVAVALAPYQVLFIVVSLPLLVASPALVAAAVRRAYVTGCKVEGRSFAPSASSGPSPEQSPR